MFGSAQSLALLCAGALSFGSVMAQDSKPQYGQNGGEQGGQLQPVLTTISQDPDLSMFYSLFFKTGFMGKPGPMFEERFNDPRRLDGTKYTVFAPTNQVSVPFRVCPLSSLLMMLRHFKNCHQL